MVSSCCHSFAGPTIAHHSESTEMMESQGIEEGEVGVVVKWFGRSGRKWERREG